MQPLDIKETEKILIIAPHPDDECVGAGGILLLYAPQCDVFVLTDGRQGQGDLPPEICKNVRRKEFLSEMNCIGIDRFRMLDIEDGMLAVHTNCLNNESLQDYDKIFVTGMDDEHPDHKAAFLCVKEWANAHTDKKIPQCFIYEVHSPLHQPSHFTDITNLIQAKQNLIRFHKSQIGELPYDLLAKRNASYRATLNRMPTKLIEVYQEINLTENVKYAMLESEILLQKERVNGWVTQKWLMSKIEGHGLGEHIRSKNIRETYIYGFGNLGKLLYKELLKSYVIVRAVIDRRADQFDGAEVMVISADEARLELPVIVTVIYEYKNIKENLEKQGFNKVLSLKSLVEEV